jgi:hypothetical protein
MLAVNGNSLPAKTSVGKTGAQQTTTVSIGALKDTTVRDELHHQFIQQLDDTAEVMLRFSATVGAGGIQFEFAYDGGPTAFALVDRGFLEVFQDGESFLATAGDVRITVVSDQRLRVEFADLSIGRVVPTTGAFEGVHDVGDGFVEGELERSCQYLASDFDENTVHNSDGSPNVMLQDDPTWSSDFCARYAELDN